MMNIDAQTVKKVATLSSLALSDEEVQQYQGELSKVLNFVELLNNLPLGDIDLTRPADLVASPVTPTISAKDKTPFRADVAEMPLSRDALMSNAPETEDGAYVVPNIL